MFIADTTPTGLWSLEARVDGEVTGTHSFQIVAGAGATLPEKPRPILTPAEIYQHAQSSSVTIESLGIKGELINSGVGFFIDKGLILTAFQVIDGANSLKVILDGNRTLETHEIVSWDRRRD
ncbi:MAG: hypothetical protein ACRD50_08740 [Candidatus Acidiferrales bacterium]